MKNFPFYTFTLLCSVLLFGACQQATSTEKTPIENTPVSTEDNSQPFIKGTFFEGANGVFFDKNDHLNVASVTGRKIGVVDTKTGEVIKSYGPEEGVDGPDDLAIGPDGSLYHTNILTGSVGRRTPSGEVTSQFVSPGVNPITFSADGRLFVALDFSGDGLYELDPELKNPPRLIIKELGWLNGMDFGPDGLLYGPIWSKGQIVKIDVDKAELTVLVDNLKTPAAVKFDSKGNLFTVDHQTGIVYNIDPKTGDKTAIAKGFEGADNLALNSKDELFISSAQDGGLFQVNADGSIRIIHENSFCNAGDIEVIDNELFIPDILSLKSFDKNTGKQNPAHRHMIGEPGVIGPFTMDHEGSHIVLTSWFSNAVQIWNLKEAKEVAIYHDFPVPINAIIAESNLIVAAQGTEPGAAQILRQTGDKREILMDAAKGLVVPAGLAATNGNIYVSDFYLGKVFQVTENNEVLATPKVIIDSLQQPEGLQIGPKGNLIVVETGANQVLSVNLTNGEKSVLASVPLGKAGMPNLPPTWKLSDVDYDDAGNLYVPSDVENVVYKFDKVL